MQSRIDFKTHPRHVDIEVETVLGSVTEARNSFTYQPGHLRTGWAEVCCIPCLIPGWIFWILSNMYTISSVPFIYSTGDGKILKTKTIQDNFKKILFTVRCKLKNVYNFTMNKLHGLN